MDEVFWSGSPTKEFAREIISEVSDSAQPNDDGGLWPIAASTDPYDVTSAVVCRVLNALRSVAALNAVAVASRYPGAEFARLCRTQWSTWMVGRLNHWLAESEWRS